MSEQRKPHLITRREMLRLSGLTGLGLLAAACGSRPTPTETVVEKIVTQEVVKTVEVEKEVIKEVVVTATPSPGGGVTVDGAFWVLQSKDYHDAYNDYLRIKISDFAKENGWPIDISYMTAFTTGTDEVQKIAEAVQAGNSPDLILHTLSAVQLRSLYALDPVTDVVDEIESVFGKAAPRMYIDYFFEDQWWAVPYHQRSDGGWYRTDVFQGKGIDVQKIRQYTDLRDGCLEASDPDNEVFGWGLTVNRCGDGNYLINRIKTGWGAAWQDETGQYIATNSPEMVEAMNFIKDTYSNPDYEAMLPPGVLAWNDTSNNEAYLGGAVAFTQNAGTVYAKAVIDGNPVAPLTGFLKPPGGPVIEEFNALSAKNWMVLRGSKNNKASKMTILHFNANLERYDEMLASSPSYALPCYTSLWDLSEYIKTDEIAQQQRSSSLDEAVINPVSYPGPNSAAMVAINESGAWNDMINAMLTGTSAEEAVETAHERMVEIFKEFGLPGEES